MMARLSIFFVLLLAVGTGFSAPGHARSGPSAETSVSDVFTFEEERVDGASLLVKTRTGVGMTLNTRGLTPGAAYTTWWVTFNNPARCTVHCRCGEADFDNPRVDIGVFWAAGRVADAYGQAEFAASAAYGVLPEGDDQVPFEPSFASPIGRKAEIHIVVRSHGPASADPEELEDQLTMFQEAIGEDTHFAVHRSSQCKKPRRRR